MYPITGTVYAQNKINGDVYLIMQLILTNLYMIMLFSSFMENNISCLVNNIKYSCHKFIIMVISMDTLCAFNAKIV